jgi:soluble cytochrome b562
MDLYKDINMIKKTLATVIFSAALSFSSLSFAGNLHHNMDTLAKNFQVFNKADNQQDALKALDKTRVLVQAGKLDQAKVEGKKIAAIKAQGHAIYNKQ